MVVHGAEEAPITPSCRTDSQPAEGDHAAVMSERGRRAHDAIFDVVEFGGGHRAQTGCRILRALLSVCVMCATHTGCGRARMKRPFIYFRALKFTK